MKVMNLEIHEAQQTPNRRNSKKIMHRHITIKLGDTKDKFFKSLKNP
jgi:hypothetical protein